MAGHAWPSPAPRRRAARRSTHRAWPARRCGGQLSTGMPSCRILLCRHQQAQDFDAIVARMERSEIRGLVAIERPVPDCASLHPGYGWARRSNGNAPKNFGNKPANKQKCEAAIAVEALDPGVPYESRWAPYVRVHGPGQGQFPKGSIRPRGYMAPDERRSFASPM